MVDKVILASQSPRRLALLEQIGIQAQVHPVAIDESVEPGEQADHYVLRLAQQKAAVCAEQLAPQQPDLLIVAADTAVVVAEQILGKPEDEQQAMAMWRLLSGRWHQVMTAVSVLRCTADGLLQQREQCVITEVKMRTIKESEMTAYWRSGEPQDKAGGYAIQGRAAIFIEAINGSYSAVVGLPLLETHSLLESLNSYD